MNCRKRGDPKRSDKEVNDKGSRKANEMRKGDGIKPFSYDPVKRHPYWEGAGKVLKNS